MSGLRRGWTPTTYPTRGLWRPRRRLPTASSLRWTTAAGPRREELVGRRPPGSACHRVGHRGQAGRDQARSAAATLAGLMAGRAQRPQSASAYCGPSPAPAVCLGVLRAAALVRVLRRRTRARTLAPGLGRFDLIGGRLGSQSESRSRPLGAALRPKRLSPLLRLPQPARHVPVTR